jgi:hypothetical protein
METPGQVGVWIGVSLINHSCEPSCWVQFASRDGRLSLRTLRPVGRGEELTISYVTQPMPVFARRARLRSTYRFHCRCARCSREASALGGGGAAEAQEAESIWAQVEQADAQRRARSLGAAECLYREALLRITAATTHGGGGGGESFRSCACIGSPCLRHRGHGASIGSSARAAVYAAMSAVAHEGLARVVLCDHRWPAAVGALEAGKPGVSIFRRPVLTKIDLRVRVEIMGPGKFRNVGKSQWILIMINPMISTRTRTVCHARSCQEIGDGSAPDGSLSCVRTGVAAATSG